MGWNFKGENVKLTCEACTLSKSRKQPKNKSAANLSERPGEQISVDIISVNMTSYGGARFWALIVDKFTSMKWSFFLKNKDESTKVMIPFLK